MYIAIKKDLKLLKALNRQLYAKHILKENISVGLKNESIYKTMTNI
jgi:hypothetical protein